MSLCRWKSPPGVPLFHQAHFSRGPPPCNSGRLRPSGIRLPVHRNQRNPASIQTRTLRPIPNQWLRKPGGFSPDTSDAVDVARILQAGAYDHQYFPCDRGELAVSHRMISQPLTGFQHPVFCFLRKLMFSWQPPPFANEVHFIYYTVGGAAVQIFSSRRAFRCLIICI